MELLVNGKPSAVAPVTIIVAPLQEVPNLPAGYYEVSRWTDGTGTTTIRCWPQDHTATRIPLPAAVDHGQGRPVRRPPIERAVAASERIYDVLPPIPTFTPEP